MLLVADPLGVTAQPTPAIGRLVDQGVKAGAPRALMQQVVQRAKQVGLGQEQTAPLLRPAVELARQGLPAQGVLKKSLEGLGKGLPVSRIQPVLRQVQIYTQQAGAHVESWIERPKAREMMGTAEVAPPGHTARNRAARNQIIRGAVLARRQGVSLDAVQRLLEALPSKTERRPIPARDLAAALHVMPALLRGGASLGATIGLLTRALGAGYGPSALSKLLAAMHTTRCHSQLPPDVVARRAARAIARGAPATDVVQSLFNRGLPGGPLGEVGSPLEPMPPGQGKPPRASPKSGHTPPGGKAGRNVTNASYD